MSAILSNDWYISANQYDIGPSSGTATEYQKTNAQNVYDTFSGSWSLVAIAGMLGNMMYESCLDPACVYPKSSFPNGGATLEDISNEYALPRPDPAYGLVQWKGKGSTAPIGNQLVSYAYRHGSEWYEGQIQMDRLIWEYESESKWHSKKIDGVTWTFANYASNTTLTPERAAYIFMTCYEGTYSVVDIRGANARYWYEYFQGEPGPGPGPTPEGWITGEEFSQLALAYDGQYIPYHQCDCIHFVNMVWRDIPASAGKNLTLGTNSIWRSTVTFNTTSPDGQNPCPELWYQDTIENCIETYGFIPAGTLLFHQIGEDGPPAIPDEYRGDGVGNFAHVGIYCGDNQVMQSGGRDGASVPGGGVHSSEYDPEAWNYCAFVCYVDPQAEPEPEPEPEVPTWLLFFMSRLKKERVIKYV